LASALSSFESHEPDADAGPAELDCESYLAPLHAPAHIVVFTSSVRAPARLYYSCGTRGSENARRTTRGQLSSSGSNAAWGNIRLRVESQPEKLEGLAQRAHERRIQMLLTHALKQA